MFSHFKTSIKTSVLFLLFTNGSTLLFAGNPGEYKMHSTDTFLSEQTEISKEIAPDGFTIPANYTHAIFDFQVNSDISYLNFSHFKKDDAKKMFFQAWLKEKELNHLTLQTDSLRKAYAASANEQKDAISVLILKNESQAIALSQEIPAIYQSARTIEGLYWQSVSIDEVKHFQEKINSFRDSLFQAKEKKKKIENPTPIESDIVINYTEKQKAKEAKPETNSGVVYKIQIGFYKGKTPEAVNRLIKKLSVIRKIEKNTEGKGITTYTTGNLKKWQEAVIMQTQVKQEGVKNATIAAFLNGKRITVEEAKKINKEL